jgi:predicted nucleotidyltransferase
MNPRDPNVGLIESVAQALGPLNDRVVYLGGCAVGLLITDEARPTVRATLDVDVIVEVASRADYYALAEDLKRAGFAEDHDAAVLCRWRLGRLQVDVIPTDPSILGFSNRWLPQAVDEAHTVELPSGRAIRLIPAPLLIATKLEAFYDRGEGDFRASHDLEDIVNLVDGRAELLTEVGAASQELQEYLRDEFDDLLADTNFTDALAGHLGPAESEQARVELVIERLRQLAGS